MFTLAVSLLALSQGTSARPSPYPRDSTGTSLSNAQAGLAGLLTFYNQTTGMFDTSGWWNGANCLTAMGELAYVDKTSVAQATEVYSNSYARAPTVNPQPLSPGDYDSADPIAWCDHCYDDNGWFTMMWIQAYDVTSDARYLTLARAIFDNNIIHSRSAQCGGVVWCDNNPYVNAIANELFLSEAAHLANRVDAADKAYYTNIAQQQWDWFAHSGLINSQNLINDGLEDNCTNTGTRTVWSYNMGVILGGLVELNKAAPNSSLIDAAHTLAQAGIGYLCDSNHVLHEVNCEPSCEPDQIQFKGIYIRNLVLLQNESPMDLYQQVIDASAQSIWNTDRTSNNTFGVTWTGPADVAPVDAGTTGSALGGLAGAVAIA